MAAFHIDEVDARCWPSFILWYQRIAPTGAWVKRRDQQPKFPRLGVRQCSGVEAPHILWLFQAQ